jgi:DNA-binding XRE family transcriptional regulator
MEPARRAKLSRAGWRAGSAREWLKLDPYEAAYIEMKLGLADLLRRRRRELRLTQALLAVRLGSSQSRVAKMEAADRSVSLDLLFRSLLALDVPIETIGQTVLQAGEPVVRRAS